MSLPVGNFASQGDFTMAGHLKVGEFGWVEPINIVGAHDEPAFLPPQAAVFRSWPTRQGVMLACTEGGLILTFFNGATRPRGVVSPPSNYPLLPIAGIVADQARYQRWHRQLESITLATMTPSSQGFIHLACLREQRSRLVTSAGSAVTETEGISFLPVWRGDADNYAVQMSRMNWVHLVVLG